jgi:phage shock protein A
MKRKAKKIEPKYVTMSAFEKIIDRHEKAFIITLKEIQAFREEAREYRQTMSSLMHTDIKQERNVENLRIRVERLEAHIK